MAAGLQVTLLRAKFKDLLSGGVGPSGGQVDVLSIDGFQVHTSLCQIIQTLSPCSSLPAAPAVSETGSL